MMIAAGNFRNIRPVALETGKLARIVRLLVRVLNGTNLRLEKGFIYTLKGGNDSPKITLINIISGFLKTDEGSVDFGYL